MLVLMAKVKMPKITKSGRGKMNVSYKTFFAALIFFLFAAMMYLGKEGYFTVDASIQGGFGVGWIVAMVLSLILVLYDLMT